jgi:hypothetical protein
MRRNQIVSREDLAMSIAEGLTKKLPSHTALRARNNRLVWVLGLVVLLVGRPLLAQDNEQSSKGDSVVAISTELCRDMKQRHVLNPGAPVGCERLRLVRFGYVGFDGQLRNDGEIVVLDAIADHVLQIFATLQERRFPIAKARLINEYGGDDDASMDQNNTSAFNHRQITGGGSISPHAYGTAIDLNPIQNPYLRRSGGVLAISPKSGAEYAVRKTLRPGMSEVIVDVFADQGLSIWGGHWNNPIDYQHFQVSRKLTDQLIHLPLVESSALFERHVEKYRACVMASAKTEADRRSCAAAD